MSYTPQKIARELRATADGQAFYGNALRVAKDLPCCTAHDRAVLDRWATGNQTGPDRFWLQEIAIRIHESAQQVTKQDFEDLARCVAFAADWRGSMVGNPDPAPLAEFDAFIRRSKKAITKLRKLSKD